MTSELDSASPMNLDPYLHSPRGWAILAGIIFLILMTNACHEGGHALAAWWGGDRRKALRRRCTLNPLNHFHWFLTLVLPVLSVMFFGFMFGGARPVMIDRSRLGRVRMALAALAGPAGNFLCAGFLIFVLGLAWDREWFDITRYDQARSAAYMLLKVPIWFSIFLGLLNLIPFPGLDGGHVLAMLFLPSRAWRIWYMLTPLGLLGLLCLLFYFGGYMERWDWIEETPRPGPFMWLSARVDEYIVAMRDWWGTV